MTRKERRTQVLEHFKVVSTLISPIDSNQHCTSKEIKLDEHNIDTIIEIAERMKHVRLKRLEVVAAISDYYLTVIKPPNPYIIGFRFSGTRNENGKNVLKVFATIQVNLISPEKQLIEPPLKPAPQIDRRLLNRLRLRTTRF